MGIALTVVDVSRRAAVIVVVENMLMGGKKKKVCKKCTLCRVY
jgi:hypothetical protein